jgi:hypothetical protein
MLVRLLGQTSFVGLADFPLPVLYCTCVSALESLPFNCGWRGTCAVLPKPGTIHHSNQARRPEQGTSRPAALLPGESWDLLPKNPPFLPLVVLLGVTGMGRSLRRGAGMGIGGTDAIQYLRGFRAAVTDDLGTGEAISPLVRLLVKPDSQLPDL